MMPDAVVDLLDAHSLARERRPTPQPPRAGGALIQELLEELDGTREVPGPDFRRRNALRARSVSPPVDVLSRHGNQYEQSKT